MAISIVGLLVGLIIACVLIWGAQRLLTAFGVQEPFYTLIFVVVVIIAVLIILQASGVWGPWGSVHIR